MFKVINENIPVKNSSKIVAYNIPVKNSSKIVAYNIPVKNSSKAEIPLFYIITGFYKRFSREHYKRNFIASFISISFISISFISISIIKVIYTYALSVSYNSNLFYSPISYRTIYNAI